MDNQSCKRKLNEDSNQVGLKHELEANKSNFRKGNEGCHKTRSLVWDHFTRLNGNKDRAACNWCGKEYAANPHKNGTSCLLAHLENRCPFRFTLKKIPFGQPDKKMLVWETKKEVEDGDGISQVSLKLEPVVSKSNPQRIHEGCHNTRSLVWDHFTRLKHNKDLASCNWCGKEYAANPRANGTSSMKTHLENRCPFRHTLKNLPFRQPDKKQKILTWERKREAGDGNGISIGILKAVSLNTEELKKDLELPKSISFPQNRQLSCN